MTLVMKRWQLEQVVQALDTDWLKQVAWAPEAE